MRTSLCIAAALLATNIALLDRLPEVSVEATVETTPVATPRAGEAELKWLAAARYAGWRRPTCAYADPLAILDADIDPSIDGREHVIGNLRDGVAMYTEGGMLVAMMRGIGCRGDGLATGDQSLSITTIGTRVVLRTRQLRADGEHLTAFILDRRGDELVIAAELDAGGKRTDWEAHAEISLRDDRVFVKMHGRQRVDGRWIAVDAHRTYPLQ